MNITEQFLADVANHQMTVIREDGVNRHLRFQRPGTMTMYFDLITWPGYLCYTGDMGTYVFRRLNDMFGFFRREENSPAYRIDMRYWAEKAEAADKTDGLTRCRPKTFVAALRECFDSHVSAYHPDISYADREDFWEEAQLTAKWALDEGDGRAAIRAVNDYCRDGRQVFPEFWAYDVREFSHRFEWCCHALEWAIGVYDASRTAEAPRAPSCENTT